MTVNYSNGNLKYSVVLLKMLKNSQKIKRFNNLRNLKNVLKNNLKNNLKEIELKRN